jgi:uncharacterized membrane protein YphA (DoxX/SURF4 family)
MGRLDAVLLAWHRRARSYVVLYRFTLATRLLLAVGFIPTGMVKVLGRRFTTMSPEYPIGAFFEILYQSGPYWHFIGWAQVIAGLCVLVPATATLGALLFFPIMLNIFVITHSYDFNFTPVVTGLMLIANVYLLCWDYDRLRGIFGVGLDAADSHSRISKSRLGRVEWIVYVVGGGSALSFLLNERLDLFPRPWNLWPLLVGLLSACVAMVYGWTFRNRRIGMPDPHVTRADKFAEH